MKSKYKLHLGNTKTVLDEMINRNEKIDMIFTSPPYFAFRKNYSGNSDGEVGSIHVDDYADWFLEFTEKFLQVLKPNGSFFLNINEKIDNGVVHPVLDELKYKMRKQGWYLVAKPYIWFKKQCMPTNCKYRAIDRYEYVFHFSNSTKPKFRAENCRVPHSATTKKRMKPFHVELAEWFVKVGSDEGDTVLDPFAGSSTTGVAALKHNRNFIGIDLIDFNINFGEKRIQHLLSTGECYIPKNKLEKYGIDVNYYKVKGKHINNP